MKKQIFRKIIAILVTVSCLLLFALPSSAAEATEDIFNISQTRNMAIKIEYDSSAPSVKFIAPNGTVYDSSAVSSGKMQKEDSGDTLFYYIPNASAGQWKIVYDKGSNSSLGLTWAPYGELATIESLKFTTDGDRLSADFSVSYIDNSSYSYVLSAALVSEDGIVIGKKTLASGSAAAGRTNSVTASLSQLNSYASYRLLLDITMDSNGIEVFDSFVADGSFSYTNSNIPAAMSGFKVEVGLSGQYILADWSETREFFADGYIISIYKDSDTEPVYFAELDANVYSEEVAVELAASKYRVELRYKNNSMVSAPVSVEIDMSLKELLTIPSEEVTNASQIKIEYDFSQYPEGVKAQLECNGSTEELIPTGKGFFTVPLEEYQNDISVVWHANDSLSFRVGGKVYSDTVAPLLSLYEITSSLIRTERSEYILVGTTTVGCTVTVGDQQPLVGEDGAFTATLGLKTGLNEFTVTVTSPSGNITQQSFTIERLGMTLSNGSGGGILEYLPLMLALVVSFALALFVLISVNIFKKQKAGFGVFFAIKSVVSNSLIFAAVSVAVFASVATMDFINLNTTVNSVEFYDAASQSVTGAYALIEEKNLALVLMIWLLSVTVVLLALAVITRLLPSSLAEKLSVKNRNADRPKKEKAPKPPKAAKEAPVCFCPNCGAKNPADSTFCGECGSSLGETKQ